MEPFPQHEHFTETGKPDVETVAARIFSNINKEYLVIGRSRLRVWHTWVISGFLISVSIVSVFTVRRDLEISLASGEVEFCTPVVSGLAGWWTADGDASDVRNSSNGVLQNGAKFVSGKVGSAFDLDGTDDYVRIPSFNLALSGAISVEGWIYLPDTVGQHIIISQLDGTIGSGQAAFALWLNDGEIRGTIFDNSLCRFENTGGCTAVIGKIATGAARTGFHHIAMTYGGGSTVASIRLYLDGVRVDNTNLVIGLFEGMDSIDVDVLLGTFVSSVGVLDSFYDGYIDEMSIYDRELSASEVRAIALSGSAGKCPIGGERVAATVIPGEAVTTDREGDGTTIIDQLEVRVISPSAGAVVITETIAIFEDMPGFELIDQQVVIAVPLATPEHPIHNAFAIHLSAIPQNAEIEQLVGFKDDKLVPNCKDNTGVAIPNPCVSRRLLNQSGNFVMTALSTEGGKWHFGVSTEPVDSDHDGIPDNSDTCPEEDASGFDADVNGCFDTIAGLIEIIDEAEDEKIADQIKGGMIRQLTSARSSVERGKYCTATKTLGALVNTVNSQEDKKIDPDTAALLLNYQENITVQIFADMPEGEKCK